MTKYIDFLPSGDLARDVQNYFLLHETQGTHEHTLDVLNELFYIKRQFGYIEPGSLTACYLHDIGRVVKTEEIIDFCLDNCIDVLEEEKRQPSILHQKVSCFISEKVFGITDSIILDAIKYHTTSRYNPSMTEIEVFLADKMSWKEDGYKELAIKVKEQLNASKEKAMFYYLSDLDKNSESLKLYHEDSKKAFMFFSQKYAL